MVACLAAIAAFAAPPPTTANSLVVVFDEASGTGPTVRPSGDVTDTTIHIADSLRIGRPPADTVAARSRLDFRWHAEPTKEGVWVVGYRYKLSDGPFVVVDSATTSASFNVHHADSLTYGTNLFTVVAKDNLGNERSANRYFWVDFTPDTWFAGPDTTLLDQRFGWTGHQRSLDIPFWNSLPDLSGTMLSCDSLTVRPLDRESHKTFFEIWDDRIYVRTENDTVHMNSWVVTHGGGYDLDSPYHVRVVETDPALADTAFCPEPLTLRPAGLIGSPIAHQYTYLEKLDPHGNTVTQPVSSMFPVYDPAAVDRTPRIGGYTGLAYSGKMYYLLRAVDGHLLPDRQVFSATAARDIADLVDAGMGTPAQNALRSKILTFYVNYSPYLRTSHPDFAPRPYQNFADRSLELNLIADDPDPYDRTAGTALGGPSEAGILRWNVTLHGKDADGQDVSHSPLPGPVFTPLIAVDVPDEFADSLLTVEVELCDCAECETDDGAGRCITHEIPVQVRTTTAVEHSSEARFGIESIRPNPAIGEDLTIHYAIARAERARIEILDVAGRRALVRELEHSAPGRHALRIGREARLAPGVYVVRLVQGGDVRTARVAVLR